VLVLRSLAAPRGRGREGLTAMTERLPITIFALVMAAIPFIPGMPPFWIVLLDNIGLSALVAMGLVLLTGVGGLTSFGQAAFCGLPAAYTTGRAHHRLRHLALADLAAGAVGQRRRGGRARPRHGAAGRDTICRSGTIALGHRAVLPVQQARIPRPQ